jgi:small multidrug resistance family-3 protein
LSYWRSYSKDEVGFVLYGSAGLFADRLTVGSYQVKRYRDLMKLTTTLLVLFTAAVLEAGGDALVRSGLNASVPIVRGLLFLAGGLVLFSYGWVVNAPPWDFGRLLGVYVVFFFVVAQLISWVAFSQRPNAGVMVGGLFVVIGGLIIALA